MTTQTSGRYFQVTLPSGNLVVKKAGNRNYTHAVVIGDEVVSWHIGENLAKRAWSKRLESMPRSEWHTMTIERVRAA